MSAYPIPGAALDDRLAFVGTSGSGKTYAAGTAVERILTGGGKVVIVDPLDVWYGLRVKPNGRDAAFPVVIFGGDHADLPLTEHAGALIGEAVASMSESCIVALAGLGSKAAERRFMLAFLERLYRKATGEPFHLIFDEADLWAPQRSSEPQLQALMENIVRRGRVKGFLPWLITQRPAVISKDVLSQVDGLVTLKLTSSQDRDALGAWIDGQADRADEKRIRSKLPSLQRGQGIVWIPARGILDEVFFPPKTTFDSSSTPKRGEAKRTATLKPLDIGKLQKQIAAIVADTAPKAKAKGAGPLPASQPVAVDAAAIRAAEDRGRQLGFEEGKRVGATEGYLQAKKEINAAVGALQPREPNLAALPRPAAAIPSRAEPVATNIRSAPSGGEVGDGGLRRILIALAQCPRGLTNRQIGVRAALSSKSGTFSTYISKARSNGWIDGRGVLTITSAGISALGSYDPLPTGPALLDHWIAELGDSGASRLLRAVADVYPHSISNAEAAERANLSAGSGTFSTYLSKLRTLELISGRGELRASDDLFSEAA